MNDERLKQLMEQVGMPNSRSLYQALQQAEADGAARRDAEVAELVAALEGVPNLITVMRMPNIEQIADNHNRAVHGLRQAIAKVRKP